MNSQRKLEDIYSNISKPVEKKYHSLTEAYDKVYIFEDTQSELPGIAPGSGEEESSHMAVFYIDKSKISEELVAQFRELGGEGPVHIPESYFNKIEKRFRGKTIESIAHEWLAISSAGKVDNVTYESVLNKLFASDIKGAEDLSEFKQFIEWKKGNDEIGVSDELYNTLQQDVIVDVDFKELLVPVAEFFIASDPVEFLRDLWSITEQGKRVGIGKGEMMVALMTRGFKGEPGDVKFKLSDGEGLDIEVKGQGGRPGKEKRTHKFKDHIKPILANRRIVLSMSQVDDIQKMLYNTSLTERWDYIYSYLNTTLRNKPEVRNNTGVEGQPDRIVTLKASMEKIIYRVSKANRKKIASDLKDIFAPFMEWLQSLSPKNLIKKDIITMISSHTENGLAFYVESKNKLQDSTTIAEYPSWNKAVRAFFNWFAREANLSENEIAAALVETRSDTIKNNVGELQDAITKLLMEYGKEIVFDGDSLSYLVAAIQFTGYSVSDGHNRLLIANDNTLVGKSIPTYPDDVETTLNNLYSEFSNGSYSVSMHIDEANKGVQLSYVG